MWDLVSDSPIVVEKLQSDYCHKSNNRKKEYDENENSKKARVVYSKKVTEAKRKMRWPWSRARQHRTAHWRGDQSSHWSKTHPDGVMRIGMERSLQPSLRYPSRALLTKEWTKGRRRFALPGGGPRVRNKVADQWHVEDSRGINRCTNSIWFNASTRHTLHVLHPVSWSFIIRYYIRIRGENLYSVGKRPTPPFRFTKSLFYDLRLQYIDICWSTIDSMSDRIFSLDSRWLTGLQVWSRLTSYALCSRLSLSPGQCSLLRCWLRYTYTST